MIYTSRLNRQRANTEFAVMRPIPQKIRNKKYNKQNFHLPARDSSTFAKNLNTIILWKKTIVYYAQD